MVGIVNQIDLKMMWEIDPACCQMYLHALADNRDPCIKTQKQDPFL